MFNYFANANRLKKEIALTFDDGPNPWATEKVLNILDKFKIKATFFLVGKYVQKYPQIVREILKRGHLIGNHSYSHNFPVKTSDFILTDKIFNKIIGFNPKYIRFPFGIRNNLQFAFDWDENYLKNKIIIDFDNNSKDWKFTNKKIFNQVINNIKNGSIIDFHDGSENEKELKKRPKEMLKSLPLIIERLIKLRYVFKKIDELDFNDCEFKIIKSILKWDNKIHRLIYTDSEDFNKIPIDKIKQVYGICFYDKKLVIGWNKQTKMWNFQGGSVKKGEKWSDALKREIKEESNMKLISFKPLGYQLSINPKNEIIYQLRCFCMVKPISKLNNNIKDPDKAVIKIKLISPQNYKKYINWGKLGRHLILKSLQFLSNNK